MHPTLHQRSARLLQELLRHTERGPSARSAARTAQLRRKVERHVRELETGADPNPPAATPLFHAAAALGTHVGRFSDRHPILATIIMLLAVIVTVWRESFHFSTKFGNTEITISGERHTSAPLDWEYPALPELYGPSVPG